MCVYPCLLYKYLSHSKTASQYEARERTRLTKLSSYHSATDRATRLTLGASHNVRDSLSERQPEPLTDTARGANVWDLVKSPMFVILFHCECL